MEGTGPGGASNPKKLAHLLMQEALAGTVRLYPLAVNDKLRDGSLADVADHFIGGAGAGLDIDLGVGDLVFLEELLGFATIAAPRCGIDRHVHALIIPVSAALCCVCPS